MKCQHTTAVCVVSVYIDMSTDIIVKILYICQCTHVYFKDVLDCGYNRFTW